MSDGINDIIESVVRDRLSETGIVNVLVQEDEDQDGDRILRVMVIFDSSKGKLDSHKISGLARHLRSRLDEKNTFSYPVFRFVSHTDAKNLISAAA